jgi:hypothetical protein
VISIRRTMHVNSQTVTMTVTLPHTDEIGPFMGKLVELTGQLLDQRTMVVTHRPTHGWGSCHVTLTMDTLAKFHQLFTGEFSYVVESRHDGMVNAKITSPLLPAGYNGQMEMFLRDDSLVFRRETDV